jgi:hypothetical protein
MIHKLFNQVIVIISDIKGYRKKVKNIKECSSFYHQLISWSEEITDQHIKKEFLLYCIEIVSTTKISIDNNPKILDIKYYREILIKKYSNYIPSLKQKIREEKISKILI